MYVVKFAAKVRLLRFTQSCFWLQTNLTINAFVYLVRSEHALNYLGSPNTWHFLARSVCVRISDKTGGLLQSLKGNRKCRMHFSVFEWAIIQIFIRHLQDTASIHTAQISAMREEEWKIQQSIPTRSSPLGYVKVLRTQQAICGFTRQHEIVQKARVADTEGCSPDLRRQLISDQFILDQ